MKDVIEHKVGEQFEVRKLIYEVRQSQSCENCSLYYGWENHCMDEYTREFEPCSSKERQDELDVIFVKVGEAGC